MGFFNELGRQVESLKQTAADAAGTESAYECRECGERFDDEHESCPDCGGELAAVTP